MPHLNFALLSQFASKLSTPVTLGMSKFAVHPKSTYNESYVFGYFTTRITRLITLQHFSKRLSHAIRSSSSPSLSPPSPSTVTTTAVSITQTDGAPVRVLSGRPVPAPERWTAQCPARAARPARPSSSVVVPPVPRSSGPSRLTNRPRRSAGSRPVVAGVTLSRQLHGLLTGRMVRVLGELLLRGALGRVVGRLSPVRGTAAGDRAASYRRFTAACGPFIGRHWRVAPAPCSGSPWRTDGEEGSVMATPTSVGHIGRRHGMAVCSRCWGFAAAGITLQWPLVVEAFLNGMVARARLAASVNAELC